ncbi:hypothetical protein KCA24_34640, partial [Escherichia coli]|nr:hypothetical protein [Escherichia coli]
KGKKRRFQKKKKEETYRFCPHLCVGFYGRGFAKSLKKKFLGPEGRRMRGLGERLKRKRS